jgi:heptosyltransferase-2/heptosyltransferase-3
VIDSIALSEPAARILLTGVASEYWLNQAILQLTKTDHAINVADDLPLHRLIAAQERAIGMISVDTGPAHSAAALGCPLVVLFGIADVEEYLPRSPNDAVVCLRGRDRRQECMLDISVDDVVDAWHTLRNAYARRLRALNESPATRSSGLRSSPGP